MDSPLAALGASLRLSKIVPDDFVFGPSIDSPLAALGASLRLSKIVPDDFVFGPSIDSPLAALGASLRLSNFVPDKIVERGSTWPLSQNKKAHREGGPFCFGWETRIRT